MSNPVSDTPKTESELLKAANGWSNDDVQELLKEARELRRELTAEKQRSERLKKALIEVDRWALAVAAILDSTKGWEMQKQGILNALGAARAALLGDSNG